LIVDVPALPATAITDDTPGEASAAVRQRVLAARERQRTRYGAEGPRSNAGLKGTALRQWCQPDDAGRALLRQAATRFALSARGYDRVLKVARTIADIAAAETVAIDHVAEALQYRALE
jgi:magnesium chelatase family protein